MAECTGYDVGGVWIVCIHLGSVPRGNRHAPPIFQGRLNHIVCPEIEKQREFLCTRNPPRHDIAQGPCPIADATALGEQEFNRAFPPCSLVFCEVTGCLPTSGTIVLAARRR
jgi:hypothetical protein